MVIHIAFRGGGIGKQPVDPFGIALRAHYFEMLVRRDKADLFPGVALCHYVGIVAYLAQLFADGGDLLVGIFLVHADFDNIEVIDIVEVAVDRVDRDIKCPAEYHAADKHQHRSGGHHAVAENVFEPLAEVIEKYARFHSSKVPPIRSDTTLPLSTVITRFL